MIAYKSIEAGINKKLLRQADEKIQRAFNTINTVLIMKKGKLVFSRVYDCRFSLETPQPVYSVTKSVVSSLIGIAIEHGYINNVQQRLPTLLGSSCLLDIKLNAEINKLSLHQLLSMTTGFIWRDGKLSNEPMLKRMMQQSDWVDFILRLPIKKSMIGQFQYNSAVSHLLSVIISSTTGLTAEEFAKKTLFEPLGIVNYHWSHNAQNHTTGGWGLELSPIGMAKMGLLYLNNGHWGTQQVIPQSWVALSTTAHTPGYGYQWWLRQLNGHATFCARGIGGQIICCVPTLDVVIVITSDFSGRRKNLWPLFEDYWLPSVQNED